MPSLEDGICSENGQLQKVCKNSEVEECSTISRESKIQERRNLESWEVAYPSYALGLLEKTNVLKSKRALEQLHNINSSLIQQCLHKDVF